MPALSEVTGQNLSNYAPVSTPTPTTPIIPIIDQQPGLNVYLRCPLPPVWQSSPDSLRQFYSNNKVPQTRLFNPPPVATRITNVTTPVGSASGSSNVRKVSIPNFSNSETPAGVVNGINVTFTLFHIPSPPSSLNLYVNGIWQSQGIGNDYTLLGNTITMSAPPTSGYVLRASYSY